MKFEQGIKYKKCPSCGLKKFHPKEIFNCLSWRDNKTYVCQDCGYEEAFGDYRRPENEKELYTPYTPEMIDYSLIIDFYPRYVRYPLAKALSKLPYEVIDFVTEKCIFIVQEEPRPSSPGQKSFHLSLNDPWLKGKLGIILLNSYLFYRQPREVAFTVAHEVAHAYLKKNKKAHTEIEADKLAVKWLSKHYKESSLIRECTYWKQGVKNNTRKKGV